ncbi:MAG: hypothetical protein FWD90_00275 [Defluviitaleaceae bacterium]|nr:hypothetical protein [Defluviitaleaceae bacterium]
MLMTYEQTVEAINANRLLHIAGASDLLRKLPKGNWVGGTTQRFMTREGGKVSKDRLFVTPFDYANYSVKSYSASEVQHTASDAYDSGFSIVIVPYDSPVHHEYAQNAPSFPGMFIKNIAGWVAESLTFNGLSGEAHNDKAVALHLETPNDKTVSVGNINIFEPDMESPVIEFFQEGFMAYTCLVNGEKVTYADYIKENGIDTKLPLVGDYCGIGVNISIKSIDNGIVTFYAPVFAGIKYHVAKKISNYEKEFNDRIAEFHGENVVFSCNCILNFLYGGLEGKKISVFEGPVTYGEIAYQLVNQTLVYVLME